MGRNDTILLYNYANAHNIIDIYVYVRTYRHTDIYVAY